MKYNISMTGQNYSDSEEYQKEIVEGYKKRAVVFPIEEVVKVFDILGIHGVDSNSISQATAGNFKALEYQPNGIL